MMNESPETRGVESQPPSEPSAFDSGSHRETLITLGVALVFAGLMIAQEVRVLSALTDGGALPNMSWRTLVPLAVIAISLFLPLRPRVAFMGGAGAFWAFVLVCDASYFRFFGSVTSLMSAGTAHQLWDVRDSVIDVQRATDLVFLAFFVCLAAVALLPQRWLGNGARPAGIHRRGLAALVLTLVVGVMGTAAWFTPIYEDTHHIGREKWVLPIDHWGSRYSHATFAATFGLYNYHLRDLVQFLDRFRNVEELAPEQIASLDRVVAHKRELNEIDTPFAGIARGRRVVMIQLEAIVHWTMGLEVDGTPVMPFLTSLADQGLSWDYVMDVTAMGRTSDAEFAVMTGLLPDTSRPNSFAHPDRAPTYLPRVLKDAGYGTASYHGYVRSFWNRAYTHPVYGFDEMYFDEAYPREEILGLGVPDGVVYDYLLEKLGEEQEDELSFSFYISLSSHHPFVYTPAEYNSLFPSLTLDEGWGLLGPYLRSARYTDDALAAFFAGMEERGLLEDTVFVIYGDHDMGGLRTERTLPQVGPLAYSVAAERVPFIVLVPGEEELIARHRDAHTDATAGLHDTFPTLMHLLGEPIPLGVLGTNLLVPDEYRDPVPLPARLGDVLFAHRHAIHTSRGGGPIDPSDPDMREAPDQIPSLEEGTRDQFVVRELLDHPEYWDQAEARGGVDLVDNRPGG
ncbi:MAG: LTA synthase family protein [Deltaproteobacteria bacterium]|jgi:phosphoglycerol transferase MdoB-like AlkP superfamily enzyme|nr:LTA synthase family protein [Deltaproteobacteria bacterium]